MARSFVGKSSVLHAPFFEHLRASFCSCHFYSIYLFTRRSMNHGVTLSRSPIVWRVSGCLRYIVRRSGQTVGSVSGNDNISRYMLCQLRRSSAKLSHPRSYDAYLRTRITVPPRLTANFDVNIQETDRSAGRDEGTDKSAASAS